MTIVELGGLTATWDTETMKWSSVPPIFATELNRFYKLGMIDVPYDPWPPETAVKIAKKYFGGLKVLSMDEYTGHVKDRIY
jgi:hypothetical protein